MKRPSDDDVEVFTQAQDEMLRSLLRPLCQTYGHPRVMKILCELSPDAGMIGNEKVASALRAIVKAQTEMLGRILAVLYRGGKFQLGPKGKHRGLIEELEVLIKTVPRPRPAPTARKTKL